MKIIIKHHSLKLETLALDPKYFKDTLKHLSVIKDIHYRGLEGAIKSISALERIRKTHGNT